MPGDFTTINLVGSGPQQNAAHAVAQGQGNTLLFNLSATSTVFMNDSASFDYTDPSNNVPLPPNATVVVDGTTDVYLGVANGQSASVAVIPGGVNFFQLIELIVKTIVINASSGNGLFVYTGTGAAGNPPILSAVAPGTTADPFSNLVEALLTIGLLSAANTRFDANGNILVSNMAGLVVIYISPANQFIGFYPTGYGIGAPLITIATVGGNDGFGHTFIEGFQVHGNGGSYSLQNVAGNQPQNLWSTGVSEELRPATIQANIENTGASEFLSFSITSAIENDLSNVFIEYQSVAKDLSLPAILFLGYQFANSTVVNVLKISIDGLHVVIPRSGDTISYQTEELRLFNTGQTISTTAQTPITGFTTSPQDVGVGNYIIDVFIAYSGSVAAGNPVFVLNGPAGSSAAANRFYTNGAPAAVNTGIVNLGGAMNGPTYQVGAVQQLHITGQFNFTAAGVVSMTAATSVAADHLLIGGGYMTIRPIGTT